MGIVRNVLERFGFTRLRDYGLILTPDRRVLTTRTRILDDGFGGRVVGWADGDLATMELGTWGAPPEERPAPIPTTLLPAAPARPRTPTPAPAVAAAPKPAPVVAAPAPAPVEAVAAPVAAVAVPPVEPELTEDEWEWEIAMARARAAEVDAPVAAPVPTPAAPVPTPVAPARSAPFTTSQWLTKEPLSVGWREDTAIRPMEQRARASEQMLAIDRPRTVIPVPTMPVADPQLVRSHDDAMRRQAPTPRRFARPSQPPANDHTSPTISLPARTAARR